MIFCYQRLCRGLGDGIMLRCALIASMKARPNDRHILHCLKQTACMFRDISGLEITEFHDDRLAKGFDNDAYQKLLLESKKAISKCDGNIVIFQLSKSESEYEYDNAPYVIENGKYVATGKQIELSRQGIWCNIVDTRFCVNNYNVQFFDSELTFADKFLTGIDNPLVIHLNSADKSRSYRYPDAFVDYFANKWQGHIITLDHQYRGNAKNVILLENEDIRKVWAVISKCRSMVGIDSFGIHASGSTEVFTYGMFGPTEPQCRLLYKHAVASEPYNCKTPRCWYRACKYVSCLNARKPSWYWKDFITKYDRFQQQIAG